MIWSLKLQLATMLQWVENGGERCFLYSQSLCIFWAQCFLCPEAALGCEHERYAF